MVSAKKVAKGTKHAAKKTARIVGADGPTRAVKKTAKKAVKTAKKAI